MFSDLLPAIAAQTVAVDATGQIAVSGANVPNAGPYLLELDPTGTKVVFSKTGIGGSALAFDPSGNIYVAGATYSLNYPTTPGAYQTTFPTVNGCLGFPCGFGPVQGANQYVTKVDPTGSKLIYSTAVSGTGNTVNAGLAVDSAGNVYLTGLAGATYPYTVTQTPPASNGLEVSALPFLSKLDPLGQTLLFSVPIGGAGVQVDSSGNVYVGGGFASSASPGYIVTAAIPALATVPAQCLPTNRPYVAQVDATAGGLRGMQFIGGSTNGISGVALAGSNLWIAGSTALADFALTPNTLTLPTLGVNPLPGAYLGTVDFSQPQPPAGTPQIACIVDSASLAPVGPTAPSQLLTIFGTNLGPLTGVSATDNSTTTLGGANISFGGVSAPLLYASSTQINFAMPLLANAITLTVNGLTASSRSIPQTYADPSLFLTTVPETAGGAGPFALALNADGSLNSSTNPAQRGSVLSVFVNGLSNPTIFSTPAQLFASGAWSVIDTVQAGPFVLRVDLKVPSALPFSTSIVLYDLNAALPGQILTSASAAFGASVYVQ